MTLSSGVQFWGVIYVFIRERLLCLSATGRISNGFHPLCASVLVLIFVWIPSFRYGGC